MTGEGHAGGAPPLVYVYCRASTSQQILSTDQQREKALAYVGGRAELSALGSGGVFADNAVSGRTNFHEREAGGALNRRLTKGDHVVFTRLDRAFRNFRNAINQLEGWLERGVVVHIVDLGLDTGSVVGKLIVRIMAAVAEFERALISERTAEMAGHRRRRGLALGGRPPWGFRGVGRPGERTWADDPAQRAVMARIVEVVDSDRLTFGAAAAKLMRAGVKNPRDDPPSYLSGGQVKKAYEAEKRLRARESLGEAAAPPTRAAEAGPVYVLWVRPQGSPEPYQAVRQSGGYRWLKRLAQRERRLGLDACVRWFGRDPNAEEKKDAAGKPADGTRGGE